MTGRQLAHLLTPLGVALDAEVLARLDWLGHELLRWNRTHNLTAITDLSEVAEKHLADSLSLLSCLGMARRLLDLGSGAGFPALPVKIACPALEVVSVDAVGKKIAFQRHVARSLGLTGFQAVHGRAEQLPAHSSCAVGFDVVTARALGSLPMLAELARPLLAPGGRLIAMKGAEGETELIAATLELAGLGFACTGWHRLRLPTSGAERVLIILEKQADVTG